MRSERSESPDFGEPSRGEPYRDGAAARERVGWPPPGVERPRAPEGRRTPAWVKALGGCLILGVVATVVLARAVGTTALAFFQSTPASATTTRTFAVAGVPSIRIHDPTGSVRVARGAAGPAVVQATMYARALSLAGAQDALRRITVAVTQSGDTVDVRVTSPLFAGGLHLWDDRHVDLRSHRAVTALR